MSNRQTLIARAIASGVSFMLLARADAKERNASLMADARARLDGHKEWNRKHGKRSKPECAPNRAAAARLEMRQKDYTLMVGRADYRGNIGEHHKPGSMQTIR